MPLQLPETYELQRDSFRSSELGIFPTTPSHGHLELDLEATSHRSSLLVAYVRHLGLHQFPDRKYQSNCPSKKLQPTRYPFKPRRGLRSAKQAAREFDYSENEGYRLTDGDAICNHD